MKKELAIILRSTSGISIAEIVDQIKEGGKMAIAYVDLINGFSTKDVCINFIKKYTKTETTACERSAFGDSIR